MPSLLELASPFIELEAGCNLPQMLVTLTQRCHCKQNHTSTDKGAKHKKRQCNSHKHDDNPPLRLAAQHVPKL